jgi:hypothetical protein
MPEVDVRLTHVPVCEIFVFALEFDGGDDLLIFGEDGGMVDVAVGAEIGEGLAAAGAFVVADVVAGAA